ncbi:MAG: hypothetical protein U0800_16235 [Isosphaeraceae bacterium]
MIYRYPGFNPPIAQLHCLADTPFDLETFKAACEVIAPFDARSSDANLWRFPLDPVGEPRLLVAADEERGQVDCAILSICRWESSLRMQHDTVDSFEEERSEFDTIYEEAYAVRIALLGRPELLGTDEGYRHAVWRGRTGILVLQQSNYDCQFGDDINFWIARWAGGDPQPTSTFIDWLMHLP